MTRLCLTIIIGGVNFIFEGRGYDETQKFINIVNYEDTVVTNCRGVLSVWSANQGIPLFQFANSFR